MSLDEKNKCIEQGSRIRNCLFQQSEKALGILYFLIISKTT